MANKNLTAAKAAKNDEFYTRLEDINEELQHYREHFADKIVYLNCDDGEWSNFWRFFYANFGFFKLKRLIATSYHKDGGSYKYEYEGGYDQSDYVANNYMEGVVKTMLTGDGDFRSDECIEILKQADIVVTNPPFSLFREYIAQLMEYEKKFLILGNNNAIICRDIFPFVMNNKIWLGHKTSSGGMWFYVPEQYEENVRSGKQKATWKEKDGKFIVNCPGVWYTNLNHNKRNKIMELYNLYSESYYPIYDNYDCIEISSIKNIPCDYTGLMGVPITIFDHYCPDQFEIVGFSQCNIVPEGWRGVSKEIVDLYYSQGSTGAIREGWINPMYIDRTGKAIAPYSRILIRWKPEAMPTINDGVILYR